MPKIVKWKNMLSTTEPFNNIGLVKVRQDNTSETWQIRITENGRPYNFSERSISQVYFNTKFSRDRVVEQRAEIIDAKKGIIQYTMNNHDMQQANPFQAAYFEFRSIDGSYVDSTQTFFYHIIPSKYKECTEGSTYIVRLEELFKLYMDYHTKQTEDWERFVESNREILESMDPGGKILTELIDARGTFPKLKDRLNDSDKKKVNKSDVYVNLADYLDGNVKNNLKNFQKAIDDLPKSGGTIQIPPMLVNLQLEGFNETYTDYQLVIDKPNVSIIGQTSGFVDVESQFIEPTTNGLKSVFYFTKKAINFFANNIGISLKNRVDFGFYSNDFISRSFFLNCRVFGAKKNALDLKAYLTTFQRCEAHSFREIGFNIRGDDNIQGTSIQFLNCYSVSEFGLNGYSLSLLTYSSLINCAADHVVVGYELNNCSGVKIDFCGAERNRKPVVVNDSTRIRIEGLSIPAFVSDVTINNIIEINNSIVTVSDMYLNALPPRYTKKALLTGNSRLIVLDKSIEPNEVTSNSTLSNATDFYGYKASSILNSPFKQGLMNGWTGDLNVRKNSIGQVELSGNLTAGQVTGLTMIATLPEGHRPLVSTPIQLVESVNGKYVSDGLYVNSGGSIYVPANTTLKTGTKYSFAIILMA